MKIRQEASRYAMLVLGAAILAFGLYNVHSPANPPKGCKFHTRCHKCMEVCKYAAPEWAEIEPEHWCACHLYDDEARAKRAEAAVAEAKGGVVKEPVKDEPKKAE